MATVVVKEAGGRDYTALSAAIAALPSTFTENEVIQIVGTINLGGSSNVINVDTNGFSLTIEPFPGDGTDSDQNWANNFTAGVDALREGVSGSARLVQPTASSTGYDFFEILSANVTIKNLMFDLFGSATGASSAFCEISSDNFVIENSIIHLNNATRFAYFVIIRMNGDGVSGMTANCRNNLFYFSSTLLDRQVFRCNSHASNVLNVDSNTVIVPSDVTWPSTGNNDAVFRVADSATINANNNAIFGFSLIQDATSSGTITGDYNHSNAAASGLPGGAGVNNVGGITFNQTQPFIDAAAATFDAYPIASSALEGSGGTALSTDALGASRPQGAQDDAGMIEIPQSGVTIDLSGSPGSVASSGVNPTAVASSLSLDLSASPGSAASSGVNPTVQDSGASVTVDLSSSPGSVANLGINPTVVLSGTVVSLTGLAGSVASSAVNPTVIMPGMTVVPSPGTVASSGVNPTVVAGGLVIDLSGQPGSVASGGVNPAVSDSSVSQLIDLGAVPGSVTSAGVDPVIAFSGTVADLSGVPGIVASSGHLGYVAGGKAVALAVQSPLLRSTGRMLN